jgi:hypothetical protein
MRWAPGRRDLDDDWRRHAAVCVVAGACAIAVRLCALTNAWLGVVGAAAYLAVAFGWCWFDGLRGRRGGWKVPLLIGAFAFFGMAGRRNGPQWIGLGALLALGAIGSALAGAALGARAFARLYPPPTVCPTCRYDRTGLPRDAACPECGRR